MQPPAGGNFLLLCLCSILVASSSSCRARSMGSNSGSSATSPSNKELDGARYAAPNTFASLLLYGNPAARQSGDVDSYLSPLAGGKRSSSGLDSLAGISFPGKRSPVTLDPIAGGTFGKRSSGMDPLTLGILGKRSGAAMAELINFEPIYGRRFGHLNSMPRVFDMRTTPFDGLDSDYSE